MRGRDRFDALISLLAVAADILAINAGFLLAFWIRFDSGWMAYKSYPPRSMYVLGALVASVILLYIFRTMGLYRRPQYGHFTERIPRIVRCSVYGITLALALAYIVRQDPEYSRGMIFISYVTVTLLVIVEKNILFQAERHWAKYQADKRKILIVGTGQMALTLKQALEREPRLRYQVIGFLTTGKDADNAVPEEQVLGSLDGLGPFLGANPVDFVAVANPSTLSHETMVKMILQCERNLADFCMVPDMFRFLTNQVEIHNISGVPLVGVGKWPLDFFWNRTVKRMEDIAGAFIGLLLSLPILLLAAALIKRTSPGPVFFKQERCGERGKPFLLYKLRTMKVDAEQDSGPVWAVENDPRRTKVGSFLRAWNLDELPQFWNVLKGEMSLVGPRPERPHFVDQFKDDIDRYMSRHWFKPGLTGWAQVNGLRGNTSLDDRIKYDLYYLENWSLAMDFKVLAKTFLSTKNAY